MNQRDNKFQSSGERAHSQGQEGNQYKGHDKSQQTGGISFIVRKAEKLTTALYMVTDIMSEKEPMKWKAREAGVELLSDMMVMPSSGGSERMTILRNATKKIEQIVSFLDVAQSTRMMSEMNASVLKKEYVALKDACLAEWQQISDGSKNIFTESFFEIPRQIEQRPETRNEYRKENDAQTSAPAIEKKDTEKNFKDIQKAEEVDRFSQGQYKAPQMNVASDDKQFSRVVNGSPSSLHQTKPITDMPTRNVFTPSVAKVTPPPSAPAFIPRATVTASGIIERPRQDVGRDDRRKIILALIKQKPALTVKDIARSIPGVSEKTIQRELFAMVGDGVLIKKGDRRWSTYSLAVPS